MQFVAMTVALKPVGRAVSLTTKDAEFAHAAVFRLLTDANCEAGRNLHDLKRNKQLTISFVESDQARPLLRLTFMAKEGLSYANTLATALANIDHLRLGAAVVAVEAIELMNSPWVGISTWEDLLAGAPHASMRLRFMTPTAITKCSADGLRFMSLYPEPRDVFNGLIRRWKGLGGPELPADLSDFVASGSCFVANHALHTIEFQTLERIQIGFVGHAVYQCRNATHPHLYALNALARLAFFCGIGYQTARGMGAVLAEIGREL